MNQINHQDSTSSSTTSPLPKDVDFIAINIEDMSDSDSSSDMERMLASELKKVPKLRKPVKTCDFTKNCIYELCNLRKIKTKFGTKVVADLYNKHLYFLANPLQKAFENYNFKKKQRPLYLEFLGYEKNEMFSSPKFMVVKQPNSQKHFDKNFS
jgi:hypothetical protein